MKKQLAVLIIILAEIFVLGHRSIANHQHQYVGFEEPSYHQPISPQFPILTDCFPEDIVHKQDATSIVRADREHSFLFSPLSFVVIHWQTDLNLSGLAAKSIKVIAELTWNIPKSPHISLDFLRGPPLT